MTQTIDELGNKTSYNYNERNQVVEIAYGDKLSSPDSKALYGNSSDLTSSIANINHLGYIKDLVTTTSGGITTTVVNKYLATSDNRGQIVIKGIAPDGQISPIVAQSLSLRNILGLNSTVKLTVKKLPPVWLSGL